MKVPLKWLKEFVDITLPVEELAAKLTASGSEVVAVTRRWERVQVAEITVIEKHPNADRLRLATVVMPDGERTVVCGAPNIEVGQKIAYASIGARLSSGHSGEEMELTAAMIRGVKSEGMICSEKELGLSDEHTGILVLDQRAPQGTPLADYLEEVVIDLDITPNRPDCFSILGIAREVAALTGQQWREPDLAYLESESATATSLASVEIADPDLCPRYTASVVRAVEMGPSPAWMQERLIAAGMRPISSVVDITNYVMLETGQPLHAFDLDTLEDHKVIVRRAIDGEQMTTLDNVPRTFTSNTLLITDPNGPIGVGGIIGGLNSEVTDQTTNILLEAANFNHINIRQSETALRVTTEASRRFDKGLNQESAEYGLRRATKMLVEVCRGTAATGIIDEHPIHRTPVSIHLTQQRLHTLLGTPLSSGQVYDLLTALGCTLTGEWEPGFHVTPPWWRPDLRIPDDLVEEVARIMGYDALPTTAIRGSVPHMPPNPMRRIKEDVRDILTAAGMQEVINYSLTSLTNLQKIGVHPTISGIQPVNVTNPMSSEQEYLRTSLRPSLLTNLAANERHPDELIRLFEVGRVYLPRTADLPEERDMLVGVLAGRQRLPSWVEEDAAVDFYDAKGVLEALLGKLGADVRFEPVEDPNLHPGRTAALTGTDGAVGVVGEVHPVVLEAFDIDARPVYLFDIDLQLLLPTLTKQQHYASLSRFPAVVEDLAVMVDDHVAAAAVEYTICRHPLVTSARLFDVYTGAPIPAGKRSLAYAITYEASDHTLSGGEVTRARQQVVSALQSVLGAQFRE